MNRAPRRRVIAATLAAASVGVAATAATGASSPTTGSPTIPPRIFDADSFWYRPLPDDTPVAADSEAVVTDLVRQGEEHYGNPGTPVLTVNTREWSPPIYVADESDPVISVGFDNCQDKPADDLYVLEMFTGPDARLSAVRIPADAEAAGGSDGEVVVWDPIDDRVVELWQFARAADGSVSACWGGVIEDASTSEGVFPQPFGTTATGLSLLGGTLTADDLTAGRIEHVVGIALPFATPSPAVSEPANRSDGVNPRGLAVPTQGQRLRLPADLDLDALDLTPTARMLAEAAQRYGLVVWDTAGAISVRAQGPASIANQDFYAEIFRGNDPAAELSAAGEGRDPFPLEELELLPVDYTSPLPGAPATPASPAPDAAGADEDPDPLRGASPGLLLAGGLGLLAVAAITVALRPRRG